MSFDPSLPADNSPLSSSEMRGQLTSLKALIDAVPPPHNSSGANCQIQFADGNGAFASDPTFYFVQGDGWTSLRCNWPTTDPGVAGVLWNDSGVLRVSSG